MSPATDGFSAMINALPIYSNDTYTLSANVANLCKRRKSGANPLPCQRFCIPGPPVPPRIMPGIAPCSRVVLSAQPCYFGGGEENLHRCILAAGGGPVIGPGRHNYPRRPCPIRRPVGEREP